MSETVSTESVLRELLQESMKSFEGKKADHQEITKAPAYKTANKELLAGKDLSPQRVKLIEAAKSAAGQIPGWQSSGNPR